MTTDGRLRVKEKFVKTAVRLPKEFGPLCSNEAVIRPLFKITIVHRNRIGR